jgi:NitT/TauT family transport system permease protein
MRIARLVTWRRAGAEIAVPVAGGLVALGGWWAVTRLPAVPPVLLPGPDAVAAAFVRLPGYLAGNLWVTFLETVQGFGLATGLGLALGAGLASSRRLARAAYPPLVALQAVPKLALAPLLVVALGFGTAPKVVMVVLMCLFPIVLATASGLTGTAAELVELARSLCASRWQTLIRLRMPYALPQIFVGLKTAMPLAVIGAVVGELFGATAGLGFVIRTAGSDTPQVYAALTLLGAMSIALFSGLVGAERWLVPWTRHTTT